MDLCPYLYHNRSVESAFLFLDVPQVVEEDHERDKLRGHDGKRDVEVEERTRFRHGGSCDDRVTEDGGDHDL